jgi:hypothetical protein
MEKSLKIRAKITKQKDLTNHKMPILGSIIEGKQFNGYFFEWPKVGSSFCSLIWIIGIRFQLVLHKY